MKKNRILIYPYVLLGILLLVLVYALYNKDNATTSTKDCPSCPGNMRSSADGMSCIPLCDKSDPACPDVSMRCPTLRDAPESCATCPPGWHPAGSDKCISEDNVATFISCPRAALANPASVNCVQNLGGTLEIRKDREGNEYGICRLPDGTSCEEWALFRGEPCAAA